MATDYRTPASDESVTGTWSGSAGSRWDLVNDYPDTTPTDVLTCSSASGGGNICFGMNSNFAIPAGSTAISVQVLYYDQKASSGGATAGGRIKVGGSYYNETTHNPSTSLTSRTYDLGTTNPKSGVAWTVDDINGVGANALQGAGFNSTDAQPNVSTSCVRLQVTYTEPAVITGTLSVTLDAATVSGAAGVTISGTASNTLDAASVLSGVGTVLAAAALALTLDAATVSATGTVADTGITGTLSQTLDDATLSGAGTVVWPERTGSLSVTLDTIALSGDGDVAITGQTGGGAGTWDVVQTAPTTNATRNYDTKVQTTFAAGAQQGNLLVVYFGYDSEDPGTAHADSVTDNGSGGTPNNWQIVYQNRHTAYMEGCGFAWCVNTRAAGTVTQITVNLNESLAWRSMISREYSGNASSPYDGEQHTASGDLSYSSGTDCVSSGTVSPTVAGDLIVGGSFMGGTHNGAGVTAGTGFARLTASLGVDYTNVFIEDRTESGTTPRAGLFSDTTSGKYLAGVLAFKVAGTTSITLDAATLSGAGEVPIAGTATPTLDAATLSGAGTVGADITGTLSATFDDATLSGEGDVVVTGGTGSGTAEITFDTYTAGSSGSKSWTHAGGSLTNGFALIYCRGYTYRTVTAVTFGGISCTRIADAVLVTVAEPDNKIEVWYCKAAPGGNQSVVVTAGGSEFQQGISLTFNGADQDAPTSNPTSYEGTTNSPGVTITSEAGRKAIAFLSRAGGGETASADEGEVIYNRQTPWKDGCSWDDGAASVPLSWTLTGSIRAGMIGLSITPASDTAITLGDVTLDGQGEVAPITGTLSVTLDDATLDGDGVVGGGDINGTLQVTLDAATLDGDATVLVSGTGLTTLLDPVNEEFPLVHSANDRYLVTPDGRAFPIFGRATWSLGSTGGTDYISLIDDCVEKGYTTIEINFIEKDSANAPFDGEDNLPFIKETNGTDWDGSLVDGSIPDYATPNPAFWARWDAILEYARAKGLLVMAFPSYTGYNFNVNAGYMGIMVSNGTTKVQNYGAWVANRYKHLPNIVWCLGGDSGTSPASFNQAQTDVENALLTGINSAGGRSVHITALWSGSSIYTDVADATLKAAGTLQCAYTWEDVPTWCRTAYAYTTVMPSFLYESKYEGNGAGPWRRYSWWGFLSAIGGYYEGDDDIWNFSTGWLSHLDDQNALDSARLHAFFRSLPWYSLVPNELGGIGTLITAGGGTLGDESTYVTAAATPDGKWLVAYRPPGHSGSFTVDRTKMAASFRSRWYNPYTGAYTLISAASPNTGTEAFTPSGDNGSGYTDWVLVLDTDRAERSGTLSVTLDAATLTGAGTVGGYTPIEGTLSVTLDAASVTGDADVLISGTATPTLDAATLTGAGTEAIAGTLAQTLDAATLAGQGTVGGYTPIEGTLSSTLDAATVSGAGTVAWPERTGALNSLLDDATNSGTGNVVISCSLSATLDAATLSGAGTETVTGTASLTLGDVTLDGDGVVGFPVREGTLDLTLDAATVSGAGTVAWTERTGTLAVTLDAASLNGAGVVPISGTASLTLDAATLSASGVVISGISGQLNVTLDAVTDSGAGTVLVTGTATPTLDALSLTSAASVLVTGASTPTLDTVSLTGAAGVLVIGTSAQTLADVTLDGDGLVGFAGRIGTLDLTLDDATASGSGTVETHGTGLPAFDPATLSGAGTVSLSGALSSTLDGLSLTGSGTAVATGMLSSTLGDVTLSGVGSVTARGTATLTLADATLSGVGRVTDYVTGWDEITMEGDFIVWSADERGIKWMAYPGAIIWKVEED